MRYGTAETSGPAKVLVRVQRVFVESDIGKREDVFVCNDVRCCREFRTDFYIVVVELGNFRRGHLCFPVTVGRVFMPIRTQRN